jgi:hypothetical protein
VVAHPQDWPWVGYQEIMGLRRRYRLIDLERLCWRLRASSVDQLRKNLAESLAQRIERGQLSRQPRWTESLAVGSNGFVERIRPLILSRRETEVVKTEGNVWLLRETPIPYGQKIGLKSASKTDI